jgi:hypothetical protein
MALSIFWIIVWTGISFLLVIFRNEIVSLLGPVQFFEEHFKSTENGIVVFSVGIMILSWVYNTGMLDTLLTSFTSMFF